MARWKKRTCIHPAYYSYHGNVRIPFVSPKKPVSLGEGICMDEGTPGHVVLGPPEGTEQKQEEGQ